MSDGEQEGIDEGKMVGVGLVGGDSIDIQGSGIMDEGKGVGEQNALERVLLLEKYKQYEAIS